MNGTIKRKLVRGRKVYPVRTLYNSWVNRGTAKIVTLGCSVTQGAGSSGFSATWLWGLFSYLQTNVNGLANIAYSNNGFAGYTTSLLVSDAKYDVVIAANPSVVLIEACCHNDYGNNIPLATAKANLEYIVLKIQQGSPRARIILQSSNPRATETANTLSLTYGQYIDNVKAVCQQHDWEYVDIYKDFNLQMVAAGKTLAEVLADGVHPNDTGYAYWKETLKRYFQYLR